MSQLRRGHTSASVTLFAVLLLLVTGLAATTAAAYDHPVRAEAKISTGLLNDLGDGGRDDYVIEFEGTPDLSAMADIDDWDARGRAVVAELQETATESQADVVADLETRGVDYQSFWIDNTVYVEGGTEQLALSVARDSEVTSVRPPARAPLEKPEKATTRTKAVSGVEWGIADIHADQVWEQTGARGEGLVVANIDSGVQFDHSALVTSYRGNNGDGTFDHNYNWFDPTGLCTGGTPCDTVGHGTHTMGTMVGDGGEGAHIGVAPGAQWIAVKGCEQNGCTEQGLTSAAQWVLAPTDLSGANPSPSRRPDIVNNSWSTPGGDDFYNAFVDAWVASGIFPVFSSGNPGGECAMAGSPGDYAGSYSVGNYDANGHIAGDSGRGPGVGEETKPNISAPGTAVRSSVPGDQYQIYNGTSMAAPHVAGAVALLWSAAPSLLGDVSGTRLLLDDSARDQADDQCGGDADDNNVYGEGRLDALALVNAAPRGDTGLLTGQVVELASGEPVADAHLTLSGPAQRQAVTDSTGHYSVALAPGDYDVTVSRFGYDDVTMTVTVQPGRTVQRDVELVESAEVRVRGRVLDGSGHGWPLYARVELPGTQVSTFTNPATGRYELTVPTGHTYRVRATVQYAGYAPHTEDLRVDGAGTHDLRVPVDASTCTAPGYARTGGLSESFESHRTTDRWSVEDALGNGQRWTFADLDERGNLTGGTGRFAVVDSDHYGPNGSQDTSLVSPAVDLADAEHPVLEFASDFWERFGDTAEVDLSVDGGGTWSNVWRQFQTVRGPQTVRIPVPQAVGQDDVRVRFHYLRASNAWWWQVDDVFLGEPTCAPVKGGLVVGQTKSTVTRRPLVGVEVRGSGSPVTATSAGTPDDDRAPDGLYWLFTPGSGQQRLTAALDDHADADARVRVRDDELVHQDLGLRSGRLDPVPRTITVEVRQGKKAHRRVTLANTGDAPARFDIEEVPGRPHGTAASDTGGWESITRYPTGTAAGLAGVLDGAIYSFGGLGSSGSRSDSYRYDEKAQDWVPLADLPEPRRRAAGGFVDDRFVVTSGWDSNDAITGATSIYDPETDTWADGASNPRPWTASASAVLEGRLYVVGGCGVNADCSHSDVMVYDPAADTWTTAADYPQAFSEGSCGGIRGKVYCAGGHGTNTDGTTADGLATFAYDPATDEWTRVADMPVDLWGSATAVDSERLVMVGGITNKGSLVTADSIAYDPRDDEWTRFPEGPVPLYRATGVCGMTVIGGADEHWAGVVNVERFPYGGDCVPAHDRPWLRTSASSGQAAADRSRSLTLKFDARKTDGPGVYDAYVRFGEDTPYETAPVRVRLVVKR